MRLCAIHDCGRKHYAHGHCFKHYRRIREHGDAHVNNRTKRTPIADRFWPKVLKTDGCWIWQGYIDDNGYGQLGTGGKNGHAKAHRVSYELANGSIPDGMHVLHKCDMPSCVNPAHLFLGSHLDNMRDMWRKGRGRNDGAGRKGSSNGNHRLVEEQVREIKIALRKGQTKRGLARKYKVSHTLIRYIEIGKTWKHIKENENEDHKN